MTPKLLVAAVAAFAIAVGFALPTARTNGAATAREQIPTLEIGKG